MFRFFAFMSVVMPSNKHVEFNLFTCDPHVAFHLQLLPIYKSGQDNDSCVNRLL